jgi:kanamycin kinase
MDDDGTKVPTLPDLVEAQLEGWRRELVRSAPSGVTTWRLRKREETQYLKAGPAAAVPSVADEAERTRWATDRLPVPKVIASGSDGAIDWMVTEELPGDDATVCKARMDRGELARELGRGLRRWHDAGPVAGCPFDLRLGTAIRIVEHRLSMGLISPEDFHSEHRGLDPVGAVRELHRLVPRSEHLAVCHGDYCLPNIMLVGGQVTGYLDLGELGVADRWLDIAIGAWSVTWNLGPGLEESFYAAYGVEPDPGRIGFYRLLYDLIS